MGRAVWWACLLLGVVSVGASLKCHQYYLTVDCPIRKPIKYQSVIEFYSLSSSTILSFGAGSDMFSISVAEIPWNWNSYNPIACLLVTINLDGPPTVEIVSRDSPCPSGDRMTFSFWDMQSFNKIRVMRWNDAGSCTDGNEYPPVSVEERQMCYDRCVAPWDVLISLMRSGASNALDASKFDHAKKNVEMKYGIAIPAIPECARFMGFVFTEDMKRACRDAIALAVNQATQRCKGDCSLVLDQERQNSLLAKVSRTEASLSTRLRTFPLQKAAIVGGERKQVLMQRYTNNPPTSHRSTPYADVPRTRESFETGSRSRPRSFGRPDDEFPYPDESNVHWDTAGSRYRPGTGGSDRNRSARPDSRSNAPPRGSGVPPRGSEVPPRSSQVPPRSSQVPPNSAPPPPRSAWAQQRSQHQRPSASFVPLDPKNLPSRITVPTNDFDICGVPQLKGNRVPLTVDADKQAVRSMYRKLSLALHVDKYSGPDPEGAAAYFLVLKPAAVRLIGAF